MDKNFYAVIMAGGAGTRLWPMSHKNKPKQFQSLTSSMTMIQETYARVARIVPKENILVSTVERYKGVVLEQLPELSDAQLILEPSSRGTAPAIALVAQNIFSKNPEAVVATVASDHVVKNVDEFVLSVSTALKTARSNRDKLVLVGINPTYPDTNFGYIKMGSEFAQLDGKRIFYVDSFVEKPDLEKAKKYLLEWEYLWNAGYFSFSAAGFLEMVKKLMPETHAILQKIPAVTDENEIRKLYEAAVDEPIDTAIAEKLKKDKLLVVPSELDWSDVGNWSALFDFFKNGTDSMVVQGNHIDVGSRNCLVYGKDKLVATVGLKDIVIVETDKAILIADKNRVADVKKIVEKLREEERSSYL